MNPRRYNHGYTFGFEVVSERDDAEDVTGADLRKALLARLNGLSDEELVDACDAPFDTYEVTA